MITKFVSEMQSGWLNINKARNLILTFCSTILIIRDTAQFVEILLTSCSFTPIEVRINFCHVNSQFQENVTLR